jgi:hypothetical protein
MHRFRLPARLVMFFCLAAPLGCCCERKGYILRGDFALELNRVSHLLGRYDDYELSDGDCNCAECTGAGGWGDGGGGEMLGSPEPRLHPVPTRPVFNPNRGTPTPAAPSAEETPPPFEESTAPTSQRRFHYGTTTPRGARPLNAAQPVGLQLNSADRVSRRRTLEVISEAKKKQRG